MGPDDVAIQFPFFHSYQIKSRPGSWNEDAWNQQELRSAEVGAGSSFRLHVGLDQSVPQADLEKRRATRRLGTLILPVQIGANEYTLSFAV
jgi:hypothetical protein